MHSYTTQKQQMVMKRVDIRSRFSNNKATVPSEKGPKPSTEITEHLYTKAMRWH